MAAWTVDDSQNASNSFAVPISKFQANVLRLLAAQRSPDSYIAGGIAINRQGPRFSADIDIFHDSAARLESAVTADVAAGYAIAWPPDQRTVVAVVALATRAANVLYYAPCRAFTAIIAVSTNAALLCSS